MSRNGTSVYPGSFDAFDRVGTANYEDESGYDHVSVHNEAMDALEHIQAAIGTTAGTNVLKNAVAGQFVSFTAGTETLTNKTLTAATLTSPVFNTGISGDAFLDEDNMASNSATKLASQQSIKAYVDTRAPATWGTWSPSWTDLTVGNGSLTSRYVQSGKTVNGYISLVFGTSTAITGSNPTFTLPVACASSYGANVSNIGHCVINDSGTRQMYGFVMPTGTTTAKFAAFQVDTTWISKADTSSSVPMTWTDGDGFYISFAYEAG